MTIIAISENSTIQNDTPDTIYSGVVDGRIREGSPTTNFFGGVDLEVHKWGGGDHCHSLIRFDGISNISTPTSIVSATLYLYQDGSSAATHDIDVRQMLQAFDANATWNTYDGSNAWDTAGAIGSGADREPTPIDTATVAATTGQWYSWDVTDYVQNLLDSAIDHDGLHLERNGSGNDSTFKVFSSSEDTDGQRPELIIEISDGPAPSQINAELTDTITFSESQQVQASLNAANSESFTLSDAQTVQAVLAAAIAETITFDDAQTVQAVLAAAIAETITFDDAQTTGAIIDAVVSDIITFSESQAAQADFNASLSEGITFSDTQTAQAILIASVIESFSLSESQNTGAVIEAAVIEALTFSDAQTAVFFVNATVEDTINFSDSQSAQAQLQAALIEGISFDDLPAVQAELNASISEGMTLADSQVALLNDEVLKYYSNRIVKIAALDRILVIDGINRIVKIEEP